MTDNLPTQRSNQSNQLDKFLKQMKSVMRGRLIFALDATASRQGTWDQACQLQSEMFAEAGSIGGLEIQFAYYRGIDECRHSGWTSNSRELADKMSRNHGLRASEIADLDWSQIELGRAATLHVRRAKNGKPSAHPLRGDEVGSAAGRSSTRRATRN